MIVTPPDVFRLALRSLVKGGYFTPVQAARMAKSLNFDLNWLPARDEPHVSIRSEDWPLVFLELLAVIEGIPYGLPRANWEDARDYIAFLKMQDLLKIHERLQTKFEAQNRRLAALLFGGGLSLALWTTATWTGIRKLVMQQAALGAGKVPDAGRVKAALEREAKYFKQFAAAVFAGKVAELSGEDAKKPVSRTAEAVASRADLYEGSARGLFYEFHEERGQLGYGWVIQFRNRDDKPACRPCQEAAGYYLAGQGPYPGGVCQGQGRCHCRRVPVFDPEIYRRLMAEAA